MTALPAGGVREEAPSFHSGGGAEAPVAGGGHLRTKAAQRTSEQRARKRHSLKTQLDTLNLVMPKASFAP